MLRGVMFQCDGVELLSTDIRASYSSPRTFFRSSVSHLLTQLQGAINLSFLPVRNTPH